MYISVEWFTITGFYCLVRRAPVSEDVPADAVVAEPREEIQGAMLRRPLAEQFASADRWPERNL